MKRRQISRFGWIPDLPDHRDHLFSVPGDVLQALPSSVDLRPQCPPIYDQGRIGSCTANAIAGAIQFDRSKNNQSPDFVPSRLFIYYNEREIEGDVGNDAGAQIRDGIKSVNQLGVCPETEWSYDDTPAPYEGGPFPIGSRPATHPPQSAYNDAVNYCVTSYQGVNQDASQLRGCLAAGFPFVYGFTVYDSFFSAPGVQKTLIPMPSNSDASVGGHAVLCVGYDDAKSQFICRNSWGPQQGDEGYFYMPYSYVLSSNLASDFWVINATAH